MWLNVCIFDQRSYRFSHICHSDINPWFPLVSMTTNICSADVSLSNTRGLATVVRLHSDQYCILQTLINIQESWLIPKQPPWPLPRPQMNKVVRRAAAVHEMQLFSAALGLYVTVFQKTSLHSLLSVACSKGKHLVIKERRCFLNVTTCSLIEGMLGCRGFTEDQQKIKAMQANCQNRRRRRGSHSMQYTNVSSRWQFVSLFLRSKRTR